MRSLAQLCRAAISGAIGTTVDVAILWLASTALGLAAGFAAMLGCLAGGSVNFAVSRTWAFRARDRSTWIRDAAVYALAVVGGGALWSAVLVHAAVAAGIPILFAKAATIPVVMLGWTYPVCAKVVFDPARCRRRPAPDVLIAGGGTQHRVASAA